MDYQIRVDREREIGKINPNIYGHFIEHMSRCIYGGIYEEGSSLSDEKGFRKDVLEKFKKIRVPILRWPGGNFASGYHWEDGIGPKNKRKIKYDPVWRVEESNHFGTDEFLQFCQKVGTEPYICLNLGNGTIDEAINWIEYCNRKGNSYYAKLREKNGHPEPYKVKYWGLGNEVYGEWQLGHKSAKDYAKIAKEFAKVLKWVDPEIKIIAAGGDSPEWDYEVVKVMGKYIDYISAHAYFTPLAKDYYKAMAVSKIIEERTKILAGAIGAGMNRSDSKIGIAWDEWNVLGWLHYEKEKENDNNSHYNLQNALVTASILNVFQRMCNLTTLACYSPIVNIRGAIFTHEKGILLRPQYHVFDLYRNHSGEIALEALVKSDRYNLYPGIGFHFTDKDRKIEVDYLDVSASYSKKQAKLYLSVINKHKDEDINCEIILERFGLKKAIQVHKLVHKNILAYNDINHPNEVAITNGEKINSASPNFDYQFPAHSLSLMEIDFN